MTVQFSIAGSENLSLMIEVLQPRLYERAQREGLAYAGRGGRTTIAREIGQRYALAAARIKQDISNPSINPVRAEMTIVFNRKPPSAISYGGSDTGKGLAMTVFRGQRVQVSRGFIVKAGRLQGRPFRRRTSSRNPIDFVSGPSVGSIALGEGKFSQDIQNSGLERIQEQYLKGVDRSLAAAARRRGG
jgi:hypothetical protein